MKKIANFFIVPIFFFLLLFPHYKCYSEEFLQGTLKVIYTAAIIENQYEMRKNEYLYSLGILQEFGITPYILEACQKESFFDDYECPIFYPGVNDAKLRNKGFNEARLLQEGLKHYSFDSKDMLLKLTGRYYFNDDSFIKLIESRPDIDAFVKKTSQNSPSVFTGCYGLRCEYFEQFLASIDFLKMERQMINIEDELAQFLMGNPHIKTLYVDTLNLTANIFGEGNCMLVNY